MTTIHRIFNFAAGPAVLPLPVLEQIQRDLVALPGVGMSILEISHRSATFESILAQAEADIRHLASIPSSYRVLFLQGGASLQFSMVPMNLLTAGATADYIDSGSWAEKAIKEAKKVGTVNVAATTKDENYSRVPKQAELKLTPGAAYVHMTSNNTIEGTEYKDLPVVGDAPLVSDTSSDMFSRPIDVSRHALIYSGAQKNMGPAGVTVVIIREDLLQRSQKSMPTMLNYAVHAENGSLYNTPPAFAVYALGLVMKWLLAQGGLGAIAAVNERKAAKLYAEIDRTGFYRGTAHKDCRSLMNVTFRLSSEDLEKRFIKESTAAGLDGLVMDVKTGSGAFMRDEAEALELARSIVAVAARGGLKAVARLTDMSEVLGEAAGNALEIGEAIDYLTGGRREPRLHAVTAALAGEMLLLGGLARDAEEAHRRVESALASGAAAERFARMIAVLGGPADLLERPRRHLPAAPVIVAVAPSRPGVVASIDVRRVGLVIVALGGGRRRAGDHIDHAVGLSTIAGIGSEVGGGRPLAFLHARSAEAAADVSASLAEAFEIADAPPPERPVLGPRIAP